MTHQKVNNKNARSSPSTRLLAATTRTASLLAANGAASSDGTASLLIANGRSASGATNGLPSRNATSTVGSYPIIAGGEIND